MPTFTLTIAGWHPARLNQWDGRHWSRRSRLKRQDRERIAVEALAQQVPPATGKRRVGLLLTLGPRQRAPDVDASWKSLLDALAHTGLLVDDSPTWCELMPVRCDRGPAMRTEITLEDLQESEAVMSEDTRPPGDPELLSVADVIERLQGQLGRSTIYDLVRRGVLRASRVGGRVLVHGDSLDELLRPVEPAPRPAAAAAGKPAQKAHAPAPRRGRAKGAVELW